jgi:gluconolactonase
VDGLDHPEGVAWDPDAETLWAGGEAGQLYRVDLEAGTAAEVARAPSFVLGLAVDGAGRLAVCASEAGMLCVLDGKEVRPVLREADDEPLVLPNFPAFAPDGTLYLSASGRWAHDEGRVVRLDPDGSAATFSRAPRAFANGLAVSPDGGWLWCLESYEPRLTRFDLSSADGAPEVVLELPGTVPDGLAPTRDGGWLISCYRPDRVYHLDADGGLEVVAEDPQGTLLAAPTNVCFAGRALDRVVSANLGRWHLTLLDLDLVGAPLHRPARWAADA